MFIVAFTCAACTSVGPKTLPVDQFDYNAAIAQSSQEQLLMNLVRLRYAETPTFLKVTSVISQYSRSATANAGFGANAAISGDDTATLGAGGSWTDQPTISYAPLSGQEFSTNLLTPLSPRITFGLMQSGWPAELVFRITTWSLNNVDNDIARPARRRQADTGLVELLTIWARLREAGALGIRNPGPADPNADLVVFFATGEAFNAYENEIGRLKELLDVDPAASQLRVVYGLVPEGSQDIAVLTGSIWDIMLNLAWQIDVPPEHVSDGRTLDSFESALMDGRPPIRILTSRERPEGAFVAVEAHDYWFYIDQRDRDSKRTFSFLQLLLNLAETSSPGGAPLVTISN